MDWIMKTSNFLKSAGRWLGLSCLLLSVALATASAALNQPKITSIQIAGEQVTIVVEVPAGVAKVTLESRARFGAGAWELRAVARPSGPGPITFTLPKSSSLPLELVRVRTDASEPLPASFYRGATNFTGEVTSAPGSDASPLLGGINVPLGVNVPTTDATKTREVVESDIWKVESNTLYFFNQYRGLQVIDISDPEAPSIRGTLSLPAAGEQMYVLGTNYVVLLARDGCYGSDSRVVIVKVSGAIPTVVATFPVSGQIQESRFVGTALYVAANAYRPVTDKTDYWEGGTQISSFDLAQPESPAAKGTLWYAGYGNVIMATDRFLFVVLTDGNDWNHSLVQCVDIASPDGAMQALAKISPVGRVDDKFKMNLNGDVFTVISGYWDQAWQRINTIETFSLADPKAPVKLSNPGLEVGNGEQLHATRFDGDRLYVVTFFRTDPLWVVDLSHPAKPEIIGKLLVPGWSTYIQPLGNRLVTIGIDNSNNWRVAVSLFNVENPAQPSLISKVPLGENSSWSEATYDEKAFSVLPDAGLILVPYQGYLTNGYATRVQLIDLKLDDLTTNALVQRGAIEHQFQPRRATVYQDYILSISGKELMAVNAADRDKPKVVAQTELAWNVDRVFVQGDYLIELAGGSSYYYYWWDQSTAPGLRVALASDPNTVLARLDLTNTLPIIGATVKEGRLYLAQGPAGYAMPYMLINQGDPSQPSFVTNTPSLYLSVFDLAVLPALKLTGQTQVVSDTGWGGALQALWVKTNLLVWAGGENYWNGWYAMDMMVAGGPLRAGLWYPWYSRSAGGRLAAFNVADPAAPMFLSETNLMATNSWSYSTAFTTGGLVYLSHQNSEFVEDILPPNPGGVTPTDPTKVPDPIQTQGHWIQKYYLDVIDYADAALPTVRKPVGLPGQLTGLSHEGAVVYARSYHVAADGTRDYSVEWIDACAYDGVSAALVDSLALSKEWPRPALVQGNYLFLGSADSTTNQLNRLETWTLSEQGRFTPLSAFSQKSAANVFAVFGNLLAVQNYDSNYELLDMTNPLKLVLVGQSTAGSCWYGSLTYADGLLDRGLWIPLGDYGVTKVEVTPP